MGQKTHPIGLRLGIIKSWDANWFEAKNMSAKLAEDFKVRKYIKVRKERAGISRILIERTAQKMLITIYSSRPGLLYGRGGVEVQHLEEELRRLTKQDVSVDIQEILSPDLNAALVAENIAKQIEGRVSFRMAQKRAIRNVMKAGAKGIKTAVSGRLGGADMARTEGYTEGMIPLHTLRADVDYAHKEADTTYGKIGVKVWIYKGEILPSKGGKKDGSNTKED